MFSCMGTDIADFCLDAGCKTGSVCLPVLLLAMLWFVPLGAQSMYTVTAPAADGSTTGLRIPNGTREHAYHRTVTFVEAASMRLIPAGMRITRIGFVFKEGAGARVDGMLTLFMMNTQQTTSEGGMVWGDIVSKMTTVYNGPFTIPDTAGPLDMELSSPFNYLGQSVYVAYDFQSPGPYASKNAVVVANTALRSSTRSAFSPTEPPAILADVSDFRPVIRFSFPIPPMRWVTISGGTTEDLKAIDMADDSTAWVCTQAGGMRRTTDRGKTWLAAGSVPDSATALVGLTKEIAVAIAQRDSKPGSLYKTSNGGAAWAGVYDPNPPVKIALAGKTSSRSVWCLGESVGDSVILLASEDRGTTWTRSFAGVVLPPGVGISNSCMIGSVVWFGAADRVYKSETGPMGPWKYSSTGKPNVSCLAFGSSSGTGFVAHVGCRDTLYRSMDGGLTWAVVPVPGVGEILSLQYFPGGQDAWAATSTGIWRTSDFGLTWQRSFFSEGSFNVLSSVRFFPNFQDALAIGSKGMIVKGSWVVNPPVAVSETSSKPEGYRLGLNYPNPFNARTWIEFSLPRPSIVNLTLFDVLGRGVVTLASGESGTGTHRVEWNSAGSPSGVYFYRLHARAISGGNTADYVETRKLILLK